MVVLKTNQSVMKPSEKRKNVDNIQPNNQDDFLVGEKTDGVKPTGVDDDSTGMEGDDYLGETNNEKQDDR